MDVVFRGADNRVFFGVAAENHVDESLSVGTVVSSLVSSGRSAFWDPRSFFIVASCVIVFPIDESC